MEGSTHHVELPGPRHTLQLVLPAVFELDPRSGHEVRNRTGDEDFAGGRVILNARGDVHRETRNVVATQFAFTDIQVNAKVDKSMVEPSWPTVPADWRVKELSAGDVALHDTGWTVTRVPPGFTKIMEGFRKLRNRQNPVAQLVFSDGLVAVSVFVEPAASIQVPMGMQASQGGLNVYYVKQDDNLVTVMGEVPGATIRQIGNSVAHR